MMNFPAVRSGRRTSPIDSGNLNRLFPGKPDGTITQKIADYVTTALLPLADVVVDLHSGGKTLEFVPYAACHRLPQDVGLEARCAAAMQRSEEHTSELQSLMRISYAVFCLKKKTEKTHK